MPQESIELLLLRHAKSSWADEGMADHDRPLNPRGIAAASRMGHLCRYLGRVPERILTSDACRTRETAAGLTAASGFEGSTTTTPALYLASPESILETVRELGGDARRLLVIAHNPGMQTLMSRLLAPHRIAHPAHINIHEVLERVRIVLLAEFQKEIHKLQLNLQSAQITHRQISGLNPF